MPLIGGGGAPNVSGSNPAGTGSTLNYIGDHVYGISGVVLVTNTETTLMEFTTSGDAYILAQIQVLNGSGNNDDIRYKVYLNNEIVGSWYYTTASNIPEPSNPYALIIPAGSKVKITGENTQASTGREHTATITGEMYA